VENHDEVSVKRNPAPTALKFGADDDLADHELTVVKTLRNNSAVKLRNRSLSLGLPKSIVDHGGSQRQRLVRSQGRAVRFIRLKRSVSSTSATATSQTQTGMDPATQRSSSLAFTNDAVGTSSMHTECSSKSTVRFIRLKRPKRSTSSAVKDTDRTTRTPDISSPTPISTPKKMRAGVFERSWSDTLTEDDAVTSSTPEECSKSALVAQDVDAATNAVTLPAEDPPGISALTNEIVFITDVEDLDNKTDVSSPANDVSSFVTQLCVVKLLFMSFSDNALLERQMPREGRV